jgi:hypothetical protein
MSQKLIIFSVMEGEVFHGEEVLKQANSSM